MRDNAQDTNLPRRIGDRRGGALSAAASAASAAATSAATDGELFGRIDGPRGFDLPGSATTSTPRPPLRRTRLRLKGPAQKAPALPCSVATTPG
jgi:hypothetical protein